MSKSETAEAAAETPKSKAQSAGTPTGGARADTPIDEDDKERAIAKAALTIAELSQCFYALTFTAVTDLSYL